MSKNELKNEYELSDFYCAVYLKTCGLQLIGVNRTDPRRFRFVFQDREDRAKLVEDFFAGRAAVEPRQFTAAIKEMKTLMYSDAIQP